MANETREQLEEMDEDQLKALAASRGVTVTASDGSGTPSTDDYVEALAVPDKLPEVTEDDPDTAKADKVAQSRQGQPSLAKARKLNETVPGGRYVNAMGVTVNAEGEPIDDDNKVIKEEDRKTPDSPE